MAYVKTKLGHQMNTYHLHFAIPLQVTSIAYIYYKAWRTIDYTSSTILVLVYVISVTHCVYHCSHLSKHHTHFPLFVDWNAEFREL